MKELIESDEWPLAVDPACIVHTEEDKQKRAANILRVFVQESLRGKRFLDFGSDPHVMAEAQKVADKVCGGEDPTGTFDTILVFDVLDHLEDQAQIIEAVKTLKKLSHPGTIIHVRCHPWTSRHATHAYYAFNKAYAHLFLDEVPGTDTHTVKMTTPIKFYGDLFSEFKVLKVKRHIQAVEPIFTTPELVEAFQRELNGDMNWQYHVLPIQFVDYKLQC